MITEVGRYNGLPVFRNWESLDELPITAYFNSFEAARQSGLIRNNYFYDVFDNTTAITLDELASTVVHPVKFPAVHYGKNYPHRRYHRKVRKGGEFVKQLQRKEPLQLQKKQASRAPPAVNERIKQRSPRRLRKP